MNKIYNFEERIMIFIYVGRILGIIYLQGLVGKLGAPAKPLDAPTTIHNESRLTDEDIEKE